MYGFLPGTETITLLVQCHTHDTILTICTQENISTPAKCA